ncbi:E3 ubiquitin/ISG15 ligase TRIM25 isoform X2 [Etheostoma spectabile]|uniref:E3 ubiquitin/ISG15 ligase TRIM25 isoform X2 n=1 Tax=Etheostoma spectabile TaxID=54343 RepID=UPI0013AF73DF|nr:E3 ubiquitin/ISG15 ligase TRIM25-like isoform X2 [Etheostoma spectabile]
MTVSYLKTRTQDRTVVEGLANMSVSETEAKFSKTDDREALALELKCPICLQFFSEPVSLPCSHIYCFACLQTMGEGLDQHSCPECQAEYQGTKALVKSFKMCSIIETYKATAGKVNSTANSSDVSHVTIKSDHSSVTEESNTKHNQDTAKAGESQEESSGCEGMNGSGKGKREMDEPKFRMASQVTELNLKLEMAESVLRKEREWELELTTANGQLREKACVLLGQIKDLAQSYSTRVMQLIEEEVGPGEASVGRRVSQASELTKQLRQAVLRAESLLTEDDKTAFSDELETLQPHIVELMAKPVGEEDDHAESKVNSARACPKLEDMNAELRERFGEIQRSLRNTLNPSEVTFDPETAHPNLVLSEDLKTVTFSAAKQPYPSSPQRFTNFFQVLSTQSFSEGEHSWEVELEGSPWIIGVCYSGKLARSGLPSALESSRSSWCLMWFNNLLTAFEQGHDVPLKRTTVSHRLEIRLSFKTHRLSFYNISPISGKTHVYTFKANLTEPVHLAYRMMSGHPKGRATIYS